MQVESANSSSAVVQLDMNEFREFLLIGVALVVFCLLLRFFE